MRRQIDFSEVSHRAAKVQNIRDDASKIDADVIWFLTIYSGDARLR